jgi:multiple sugar transport system substrate-binding protein
MRFPAAILVTLLATAPLGARAADLVVWWEKGFYAQEDEAVREIIAAFEQESGKEVELVQPEQDEVFDRAQAALAAGRPPDFLYGTDVSWEVWAHDDRLANLEATVRPVLDLFDADAVDASTLLNGRTGRRGLYAIPMGRRSNHVHVWKSLLERAGFTLADIPKEWKRLLVFLVRPGAAGRARGPGPRRHLGCRVADVPHCGHRERARTVPARLRGVLARPRPPSSG